MTLQTGASRCKMMGDGFFYFAKIRAQIRNAVLADRGVFQADCHRENCHTTDCYSPRTQSSLVQAMETTEEGEARW
jgi:hypothetical protein